MYVYDIPPEACPGPLQTTRDLATEVAVSADDPAQAHELESLFVNLTDLSDSEYSPRRSRCRHMVPVLASETVYAAHAPMTTVIVLCSPLSDRVRID